MCFCARIQLRRVRVDFICKHFMNYDLRFRHVFSLPGAVVQLLSQSPHLRACTLKVSSTLSLKVPIYPLHPPLRFSPLARVILDAVSNCWFRELRKLFRGYL
jgi:hypothetical protein